MAVTQYKRNEDEYPKNGYTGLAGVSDATAQKAGQLQQGYKPGNNVNQAQQQLQQVQGQKPQSYNSKYGQALDDIMQKIQNPKEFKYSFDGDELFKYYADLYAQNGKQASMDAMGQAAALTGGYGNSYAQQAGNQAYNEYLRNIYDRGMDMYDRAYQRYRDDIGDTVNNYNILAAQDASDYGRYRDQVGDWQGERDYWTGRYDTEAARDYDRYKQDLDYWTGLAQVENADYRSDQDRQEAIRQYEQNYQRNVYENDRDYARGVLESDRNFGEGQRQFDLNYNRNVYENDRDYNRNVLENDRDYARNVLESDRSFAENQRQFDANLNENIRQFNESLNWDKMSSDQKYAAQYAMSILQNGQMPSLDLLRAAGLSEEDARKMMAQLQSGGGGGGKSTPIYYSDDQMNMYKQNKDGTYSPVDVSQLTPGTYYYDDTYNTQLGIAGRVNEREQQIARAKAGGNNGQVMQQMPGGLAGAAQFTANSMEQKMLDYLKGTVETKIKKNGR